MPFSEENFPLRAISGEFPLSLQPQRSLANERAVSSDVGKICISFFIFYCEGMLSLVVLWLCGATARSSYEAYWWHDRFQFILFFACNNVYIYIYYYCIGTWKFSVNNFFLSFIRAIYGSLRKWLNFHSNDLVNDQPNIPFFRTGFMRDCVHSDLFHGWKLSYFDIASQNEARSDSVPSVPIIA